MTTELTHELRRFHLIGKAIRMFMLSAGVLLLITGVAKLVSATGADKILIVEDPIFRIQFRYLFVTAGTIEIVVALICLFDFDQIVKAMSVGFLATNFSLYRIGLILDGYHGLCPCLGSLTSAIHLAPGLADTMMKCVLVYLLIGSYVSIVWRWRRMIQSRRINMASSTEYSGK